MFLASTADILESFDQHPPLILPADGFIIQLKTAISETQLIKQLDRFQRSLTDPESPEPPVLPLFYYISNIVLTTNILILLHDKIFIVIIFDQLMAHLKQLF